jgi:hypothetical protein
VIALDISNRNARVQALQDGWNRMRKVIHDSALEMADVPGGGSTGLLVREYKGKDATAEDVAHGAKGRNPGAYDPVGHVQPDRTGPISSDCREFIGTSSMAPILPSTAVMKFNAVFGVLFISSSIALAQMGGGMPGGPAGPTSPIAPSWPYMQMFQSMAGTGMMGTGMGVGMTDDLTVEPNGTAYVIRAIATVQPAATTSLSASWQYELAAISPVDGSAMWKLPISGGRISGPILAGDGLIYLTVDNYQMFYANYLSGGLMMQPSQAQTNDGQLLVISHTNSSASVMRTIQTTSDVLSSPRIVADASGSYLVYVLGYDMMSWTSSPGSSTVNFAPGEKTLYAYRPDGSLKFSVKLSLAASSQP